MDSNYYYLRDEGKVIIVFGCGLSPTKDHHPLVPFFPRHTSFLSFNPRPVVFVVCVFESSGAQINSVQNKQIKSIQYKISKFLFLLKIKDISGNTHNTLERYSNLQFF